jgi:hypothetical protein
MDADATLDQWGRGHLEDLTPHECAELLGGVHVGRVAWCTPTGPVVIPINLVYHDGRVWIRTTPYSSLARDWGSGTGLAFQIDEVDEFTTSGWSVLVRGHGERQTVADLPTDLGTFESWAEGPRPFIVSIDAREITGKRLLPS